MTHTNEAQIHHTVQYIICGLFIANSLARARPIGGHFDRLKAQAVKFIRIEVYIARTAFIEK
jgi:hypothetical protein